mmetsp:Transcript_8920/g.19028  ORF Transcript_8920/g.19028 Transcript_8920/m.19028 type:complete len:205 (-) Transcript_8920:682-1296(-)
MFILTVVEDDIRVQPSDLTKHPPDAVTEVIEQRYLDKVLPNLGLAVTLYDVQSIEGGFVYPNDGAAYFTVRFRLVVFRPFAGEVLVGKLKSSSREGLRISLGFFDDVLIPEYALQDPSFFDDQEKLWVWKFDGNDMYMDLGEEVRFRVHTLRFQAPPTPLQQQNATGEERLLGTAAKPFSPFEVVGEINGDGLGLTSWWAPAEE